MANWRDRKSKLKDALDYDPLITIPMIEGADASISIMQERIREALNKLHFS